MLALSAKLGSALQTALPAALSALGAGARPGSFQRCSLSPCARKAGLHVASATEPGKVSAALALSSQLNVWHGARCRRPGQARLWLARSAVRGACRCFGDDKLG